VRRMHVWPRRWKGSFDNFQTRPQAIDPAYPVLQDRRGYHPQNGEVARRPQITSFMAVQKGSYDRPRIDASGKSSFAVS
jgi:hypothetical protein